MRRQRCPVQLTTRVVIVTADRWSRDSPPSSLFSLPLDTVCGCACAGAGAALGAQRRPLRSPTPAPARPGPSRSRPNGIRKAGHGWLGVAWRGVAGSRRVRQREMSPSGTRSYVSGRVAGPCPVLCPPCPALPWPALKQDDLNDFGLMSIPIKLHRIDIGTI